MSAKSHKLDFLILGVLAVVVGAVFMVLIGWGWIRNEEESGRWLRTTSSTNVEGTMICYVLYERLGYSVGTSHYPLLDETLAEVDVLLLIDPRVDITDGEREALKRWVHGGGVLVCSGDPDPLPVPLSTFRPGRRPEIRFAPRRPKTESTSVPAVMNHLPLARDVASICFEFGEAIYLSEDPEEGAEVSAAPLFEDNVGLRIIGWRVGDGRAIWLADSSFLANGWIGREDNPVLAVNLLAFALAEARGDRVAFDEYHYGFGRQETGWTVLSGLLFTTPPGWAVLCLTGAGLLFLVYKGRRFGTRRPPARPRRRAKLEYVHSVGATYRAAGANRLTLELVFGWFRRRSAEVVGLPPSASSHTLAEALTRRSGAPVARYESTLNACEAALGAKRLSSRRLSSLIGRLARMESEVFNGRQPRQ